MEFHMGSSTDDMLYSNLLLVTKNDFISRQVAIFEVQYIDV